jgi:hypothetical protein
LSKSVDQNGKLVIREGGCTGVDEIGKRRRC